MKKIYLLNLSAVVLFSLAILLEKAGFPYLKILAGLFLIFQSGLNLALFLEQISRSYFGRFKLFLWTSILSLLCPGTFFYLCFSLLEKSKYFANINYLSLFYLIISFAPLLLLLIKNKKIYTSLDLKNLWHRENRYFLIGTLIVLATLGVNMLLYRFIPEGDPYSYLNKIDLFTSKNTLGFNEARPLFLILIHWISTATNISAYWIFKIILPAIVGFTVYLTFWIYSRRLLKDRALLVSSLAFLFFPIITMEILISRPQSLFVMAFPVFLLLLNDSIKRYSNARDIFLLVAILFISLVNVKTHQFFLFLVLFSLIAVFAFYWEKIKRYPLESIAVMVLVFTLSWPWLQNFGLINTADFYLGFFTHYLKEPSFNLWFIDSYKNVDGIQMGWPGITSVFYYAYNLGIIAPFIILIGLFLKKKMVGKQNYLWLFWIAFAIFFAIAEIFPRLGLAFLPDRAWLFVAISLCFFLPVLLDRFTILHRSKLVVIAVIIISILPSFAITYLKGGYITTNESKAAGFLKENTSPNSLIISQPSNAPLLEVFAKRFDYAGSAALFMNENDLMNKQKMINEIIDNYQAEGPVRGSIEYYQDEIRNSITTNLDSPDFSSQVAKAENDFKNLDSSIELLKYLEENKVKIDDIYILYSSDKFSGLYGSRQWWKTINYFGASLSDFENNPNVFEKVYDSGSVKIWKVKIQPSS